MRNEKLADGALFFSAPLCPLRGRPCGPPACRVPPPAPCARGCCQKCPACCGSACTVRPLSCPAPRQWRSRRPPHTRPLRTGEAPEPLVADRETGPTIWPSKNKSSHLTERALLFIHHSYLNGMLQCQHIRRSALCTVPHAGHIIEPSLSLFNGITAARSLFAPASTLLFGDGVFSVYPALGGVLFACFSCSC